MKPESMERRPYTDPQLTELGDLRGATLGGSGGIGDSGDSGSKSLPGFAPDGTPPDLYGDPYGYGS